MTQFENVVVVMTPDMYNMFMRCCVVDDKPVVVKDKLTYVLKKRGPTAYNKFIGDTLRNIAEEYPDMPRNDRMKMAQKLYKESKVT